MGPACCRPLLMRKPKKDPKTSQGLRHLRATTAGERAEAQPSPHHRRPSAVFKASLPSSTVDPPQLTFSPHETSSLPSSIVVTLTPKHKAQIKCHLLQEVSLDLLSQSSACLAPSTAVLALQPPPIPGLSLSHQSRQIAENKDCMWPDLQ